MLAEAQSELILGYWWQLAAATIFMAVFVTAFSLMTDALRDALDPKLRGLDDERPGRRAAALDRATCTCRFRLGKRGRRRPARRGGQGRELRACPRTRTVALVGESGSGKSVTAMSILNLLPDNAERTGAIAFEGRDLLGRVATELQRLRGREIACVFQDPMSSLNPVFTVGQQIVRAARQAPRPRRSARRWRAPRRCSSRSACPSRSGGSPRIRTSSRAASSSA